MPDDDPRLGDEFARRLPGSDGRGAVVLVGVVHDHPASVHRVRALVRGADPDVLALELAPLALPLFERYADAGSTPPERGGEMSAAIQAASTDRVVAVDGPSVSFLRTSLPRVSSTDSPLESGLALLGQFATVGARAVACRLAAALDRDLHPDPADALATDHEVGPDDPPADQAADERRQVRRARAVASALERPDGAAFRDEVREAHMARRLSELRRDGDVLAVVGTGHLDALRDALDGA